MTRRSLLRVVAAAFVAAVTRPMLPALAAPQPRAPRFASNLTLPRPQYRHVFLALFGADGAATSRGGAVRSAPCPPGRRWHLDETQLAYYHPDRFPRRDPPVFQGGWVDRDGRAVESTWVSHIGPSVGEGCRFEGVLRVPAGGVAQVVALVVEEDA